MTVHPESQSGVTLIELIFSIVILSVSLVGVMSVILRTTTYSANPIVEHQAIAIAESYLEEILVLAYNDPDASEAGENRASYDDVDDYHGLNDTGVHNQNGAAIASLSNYDVSVIVTSTTLTGSIAAKRVDVTVTGPGKIITLTGYRTSI
jgi:MSHA pilin protein MshD